MQRIVDGIAFEGKADYGQWDITVWEKNGHREISARPYIAWTEIGPAPDWSHLGEPDPLLDAQMAAERHERNLRRAANRAKTMCRRFIKVKGFNEMLTLTYRENMQDEALCKRHFKEWVRRMRVALGSFDYCAGFEPQERGAWHVHCSTYKLPKRVTYKGRTMEGWRLGTAIWRAVVGREDGGMCFVGGKGKRLGQSTAKMAAYVSKYIIKHYELMPEGRNRYSHSEGTDVPKPERLRMVGDLREIIARCFWAEVGEVIVSHRIGRWADSYFLCTEEVCPPEGAS